VLTKRSGALLAVVNGDPTRLDDLADFMDNGAIGEFFFSSNRCSMTARTEAENFSRLILTSRKVFDAALAPGRSPGH
jgi:hypothetical protein